MTAIAAAIIGGAAIGAIGTSIASDNAADAQAASSQSAAEAQIDGAWIAAEAQMTSALTAAGATEEAARLQAQTSEKAIRAQLQMYYQSRASNAPYEEVGNWALDRLKVLTGEGPGEFKESPGYQFRLGQGNKNILSNASATGGLASGRTLKALQEYGQDYATNEYQTFLANYYQSLAPDQWLASLGQNSAAMTGNNAVATGQMMAGTYNNLSNAQGQQGTNLANIYTNMGQGLANTYTGMGNAMAQNYMNQGNIAANNSINQANAWTGAINNGMQGLAMYYGGGGGGSSGYSGGVAGYQGSTGAWQQGYNGMVNPNYF